MATVFSVCSGSSAFLSPCTSHTRCLSLLPKGSPLLHHIKKPFSVKSLSSLETQEVSSVSVSPAVTTFWQWLKEEGVISSKTPVKPGVVPEGLGLVATKDISRNEVVLQVPKRFWINPDAVAASEIGNVCSGLKPWLSVALFLIRERSRDDSLWKHYFPVLPKETDSTIYWSEEELSEIQGTQLLNTTLGVKEYVQNEFMRLQEEIILPNKKLFPFPITLDDFFWAFGILRSRAFSRLRNENLVVIPLADLINHSARVTTEDHAYEVKGAAGLFSWDYLFSLRSPLSVKAGEQIYIQYDLNKSNAELALDYGFIEPNSDRNAYTLTLGIPESDPFYDDKLDIAETNGFGETAYFDIFYNQPLPPGMIPYLRLVALGGTDAFLLEALFRNTVWSHLELPVSHDNEELLCRVVREACKSALAGYHTTIEEDNKLKEPKLDSRLAIAVGIREGEKKVLQQIDEVFKEKELELDQLEYYQERRLKDLGLCGESGDILGDLEKFM
ncbi:ribulose-1,5 bisphosphate carboxylase/oxygenase large subunit N-methyltransferase, chloroplastic [Arachis stenosperma]|uniref:ribulose-1,5 bisphosphate carboxylase/oxygenase large subunit N-methyltransferase, chloroplastic n=1 Tax=Arachis stenosperma TaxID=217475 RepID=UPI0025ACB1B7|nr:ribulose-1,5 bisphosphate carboxylase/oxygenase large subunit N-methyltransferase, chloroplastic [Arachis stenosperma]